MHEKISEDDGSAQTLPHLEAKYKALTQRPHLNLSHLFYDVDRP